MQHYASRPDIAVGTASFPLGLDTSNCGDNTGLSARFPAFSTSAAQAKTLHTLSWRGEVIEDTVAAMGLDALGAKGLDCGPVVSTLRKASTSTSSTSSTSSASGSTSISNTINNNETDDDDDAPTTTSLVWSTLNAHKIVPQQTTGGVYAMGLAAAIPSIPAGYSYSALFVANHGGPTAAMYSWGAHQQDYHHTTRLPSVTLTDVGYYTDDGAYYYVRVEDRQELSAVSCRVLCVVSCRSGA
jgi:hypothetical protein